MCTCFVVFRKVGGRFGVTQVHTVLRERGQKQGIRDHMVQQFCDTDSLRHLAGLLQGAAEKNKQATT